uniref:Uncharacterized protein n=1 Tax=Kwoniella pini CBS 10737 TaxID=1296096 RepID=A0A1B9HVQ0_9TREE|nr:uncharacterized protein I206_06239 [Kwoniella pini CBS 10737]OCF47343.1 hypothetical protein I206_06239 [Kwoniella pini CBS 10737]
MSTTTKFTAFSDKLKDYTLLGCDPEQLEAHLPGDPTVRIAYVSQSRHVHQNTSEGTVKEGAGFSSTAISRTSQIDPCIDTIKRTEEKVHTVTGSLTFRRLRSYFAKTPGTECTISKSSRADQDSTPTQVETEKLSAIFETENKLMVCPNKHIQRAPGKITLSWNQPESSELMEKWENKPITYANTIGTRSGGFYCVGCKSSRPMKVITDFRIADQHRKQIDHCWASQIADKVKSNKVDDYTLVTFHCD